MCARFLSWAGVAQLNQILPECIYKEVSGLVGRGLTAVWTITEMKFQIIRLPIRCTRSMMTMMVLGNKKLSCERNYNAITRFRNAGKHEKLLESFL